LIDDPRGFLGEMVDSEAHPARCEIFDEIDSRERTELLEELNNRKAEFDKTFGRTLEGPALESVVDAAVKQGVSPETMYRRYMNVEGQIIAFERQFESQYGLRIRFGPEALQELIRTVLNGSDEALIVCRKIFQNYHHGLKLVMERTGRQEFLIPKAAVENPERFLNELIQQTYRLQESGPEN